MANTYTQIHIHVVFVVKFRLRQIAPEWKHELYKYITGIIQKNDHKLLAINGMPDHLHILFGMKPTQSLSDLLQDIKGSSSKWINDQNLTKGKFEWQPGYGAFSYSRSQVSTVITYIQNQEAHHMKKKFKEEYRQLLEEFQVAYEERYVFSDPE